MGYTTEFSGAINLSRKLSFAEAKYLLEMGEDNELTLQRFGVDTYMQWAPTVSLDHIVWDGNEKFYHYEKCMDQLLKYLAGLGVGADGELIWVGEDRTDTGQILVVKSVMTVFKGKKVTISAGAPLTMQSLAGLALESVTQD